MTLTEQWKKGELPDGWYWVEGSRAEGIYAYTAEYLNNMYRPRNGERIIEKVPSYKEWDKLNNTCHELEKETACLTVDMVKLKELLKLNNVLDKGLKSILVWLKEETQGEQKELCEQLYKDTLEMMSKIDQVLGEE